MIECSLEGYSFVGDCLRVTMNIASSYTESKVVEFILGIYDENSGRYIVEGYGDTVRIPAGYKGKITTDICPITTYGLSETKAILVINITDDKIECIEYIDVGAETGMGNLFNAIASLTMLVLGMTIVVATLKSIFKK